MKTLFKEKCDALFLPLGFHQHKNRYWRVVGDIYQAFSFRLRGSNFAYITFSIKPLCMGLSLNETLEADGERHSFDLFFEASPWLHQVPQSLEEMMAIIEPIAAMIQSQLIPFFNRAVNCADAYEEATKLLQLKHYPIDDTAFGLFGPERFYMLLKQGRLNDAQQLQLMSREHLEEGHRKSWATEIMWFCEEKAFQRQITKLAPIEADIELTKHPKQVQTLLAENERKSHKAFQLLLDKKELKRSFMDDKARILWLARLPELLYPLGFQYYNKRFWRVAGELYQSLSFRVTDHVCQVFFGLKPLCMNVSLSKELMAEHELYDLQILSQSKLDWSLDGNCKETVVVKVGAQTLFRACPQTISAAVDSISGVIRAELIPFFERTTTCANAYQELINLNCNIPETLRFYMLLKLGRLEEAAAFAPAGIDAALTTQPEQVQLLLAENERQSRISFGLEKE